MKFKKLTIWKNNFRKNQFIYQNNQRELKNQNKIKQLEEEVFELKKQNSEKSDLITSLEADFIKNGQTIGKVKKDNIDLIENQSRIKRETNKLNELDYRFLIRKN